LANFNVKRLSSTNADGVPVATVEVNGIPMYIKEKLKEIKKE